MPSPSECVRVLVVDDESAIADTLARILRHHGFITRSEYSANAAALAAQHFSPDVLITDIVMPGNSGIDLAEWFSRARPDCRIILTSANLRHFDSSYLDFEPGREIAFIPKPVLIPELLELLGRRESVA